MFTGKDLEFKEALKKKKKKGFGVRSFLGYRLVRHL